MKGRRVELFRRQGMARRMWQLLLAAALLGLALLAADNPAWMNDLLSGGGEGAR